MLADKKAGIIQGVTVQNGTSEVDCLARCPYRYRGEDVILAGRNNNPAGLGQACGFVGVNRAAMDAS